MSRLRASARALGIVLILAFALSLVPPAAAAPAAPMSSNLRISQVYGGGGNTSATYKNDFIELFNAGTTTISIAGWSVQYASATGNTWSVTNITGSIDPGKYYLIQEAAGTGGTVNLPTPDAIGTIAMSATAGKVALVSSTTALSGNCPTAGVIDFIGFGTTADCREGAGNAPAPSNTTADLRKGSGCTDTDQNASDFATGAPNPRNSGTAAYTCDAAPTVSTVPANGGANVGIAVNIVATFSEAVTVTGTWYDITCSSSSGHAAAVSGGPTVFTLDPAADFTVGESCTVTIYAAQVTDQDSVDPPDNIVSNYVATFTVDTRPSVTGVAPADNAINVPTNAAVSVTFDENISFSGTVDIICTSGTRTAPPAGGPKTWSLPHSDFAAGDWCTITIAANQITDVDTGDPPDNLVASYQWDFTVASAPTVTATTPASGAIGVAGSSDVTVTFSKAVTVGGEWFQIACPSGTRAVGDTAVTTVDNITFTINPNADFSADETCTATIYAAQVTPNLAGTYTWSFTIDVAPSVSSTTPANGAIDVAQNADISVTFSEAVAVATGSFTIVCGSSGSHTFAVSGSGGATVTLNPDVDFRKSEVCTVTADKNQVSDVDAGDPPDHMAADYAWSFTVVTPCSQLFFSEYIEGSSFNKALEIFNGSANAVNLAGYTVELYSNGATSRSNYVDLSGALAAGAVYVLAHGNAATDITGLADLLDSNVVNFNGDDAVALRYNGALIDVIGRIGERPAAGYWGSNPTTTQNHTLRRKDTISAGDANGGDVFDPATEWDSYVQDSFDGLGWHAAACGGDAAPTVTGISPSDGSTGVLATASITVNFSEAVTVSGTWFAISCPTSGSHTAVVTGGPQSFTLDPDSNFSDGETCTVTIYAAQVADQDTDDPPNTMASDRTFSFGVGSAAAPCSTIPSIQGTGNASTCLGHRASIQGCITGVTATGFYFQDVLGDGNPATSDGIFAYYYSTWTNPSSLAAGTLVNVSGSVVEYYDTTEFAHKGTDPLSVTKTGTCTVPDAVAVAPITNPGADPMTLYEKYEGMRVKMSFSGWVVGPTKRYISRYAASDPEIAFVDFGSSITDYSRVFERDYAGYQGINYLSGGLGFDLPDLDFGDGIAGADITGVLGYQFSKYTLLVDAIPSLTTVDNTDVASSEPALDETKAEFDVCFMNVENLFDNIDDGAGDWGDWAPGYPTSGSAAGATAYNAKLDRVAAVIVNKVKTCMVFGLQEMEGKQGVYDALVAKVNALDASTHTWTGKYVESGDSRDISQGFLYRNDVTLVGGALTPVSGVPYTSWVAGGTLDFVRVPASGLFRFNAGTIAQRDIFIYAVHFKSKGNSSSCTTPDCTDKREKEAADLRDILAHHQAAGEYAIAGGDYNDTFGSTPIGILDASASITSLYYDLAEPERYSYIFNGESEVLDHYYTTKNLLAAPGWLHAFSVVHVDADFPASEHASDHDPLRGRFRLSSDYSDLPVAYGHAWHFWDGAWRLGAAWTDDSSFSNATDNASDDGVTRNYADSWNDTRGEVYVTVTGPGGKWACLNAWLDYSAGSPQNNVVDTPDGTFNSNEYVIRNWPIQAGADQLVTFPLEQGVINVAASYNVRFRLVPAPTPTDPLSCTGVTLAMSPLAPDGGASPTGPAEGGEVEDYTFTAGPTAVSLESLSATVEGSGVLVEWTTAQETDNQGFNLWRGTSPAGPDVKLNAAIIPSQAPGGALGASYQYADAYQLVVGTTYYYWLEDVSLGGATTRHEPVSVTYGGPTAVTLADYNAVAVAGPLLAGLAAVGVLALAGAAACMRRRRAQGAGEWEE